MEMRSNMETTVFTTDTRIKHCISNAKDYTSTFFAQTKPVLTELEALQKMKQVLMDCEEFIKDTDFDKWKAINKSEHTFEDVYRLLEYNSSLNPRCFPFVYKAIKEFYDGISKL